MRSWTMSLRSLRSTWKGVAPWTAASALASAFLSSCSISQSHSRGGGCSCSLVIEEDGGGCGWSREVDGVDGSGNVRGEGEKVRVQAGVVRKAWFSVVLRWGPGEEERAL